jgi:hypothetical protein
MREKDEKRWQRHMADESIAIAAQQVRAGDAHSPVKGPGLHGDFALNAVAKSSADQSLRECVQRLEDLIEDFRARGEPAIPVGDLLALIAGSRTCSKEAS